jgi:hypothetical protein
MTQRERALVRGPDVIAGTPGGSVKRETETMCGIHEDVRAALGAGWGAGAVHGGGWGTRAARGMDGGA